MALGPYREGKNETVINKTHQGLCISNWSEPPSLIRDCAFPTGQSLLLSANQPGSRRPVYVQEVQLGYKINLYQFKRIKIISSIFFEHNGIKLEINFTKNTQKLSNIT